MASRAITVRISEARLRKLMRARKAATQSELINTLLAEEEDTTPLARSAPRYGTNRARRRHRCSPSLTPVSTSTFSEGHAARPSSRSGRQPAGAPVAGDRERGAPRSVGPGDPQRDEVGARIGSSWRACWLETGRLLPRVFPDLEAIGLARLQNDLLLALTARHTESLFVTGDAHFTALRRHVSFTVKV